MISDEDLPHSFLSLTTSCFSIDIVVMEVTQNTRCRSNDDCVKRKTEQNKTNSRTTSHFLMLLEENHIAILCFSTEGSCASAHTSTCELVVPVKWVRAPQEVRFMYFRTMCQHLWKKVQCTVLVCLAHAHTLILTQGDGAANKQQKYDLNASPGNASIRLFALQRGQECWVWV